jgi:hypothetical protein
MLDDRVCTIGARGGATSRKVAGSFPDFVVGILHLYNPSGRIMGLESTQPVTEMCTTTISLGKKATGPLG